MLIFSYSSQAANSTAAAVDTASNSTAATGKKGKGSAAASDSSAVRQKLYLISIYFHSWA